jgi:hypothetical protein
MSLRYEQYWSLLRTRDFLRRLLTSPRLPQKELKREASSCLRHYPFMTDKGQPIWSRDPFTDDDPRLYLKQDDE